MPDFIFVNHIAPISTIDAIIPILIAIRSTQNLKILIDKNKEFYKNRKQTIRKMHHEKQQNVSIKNLFVVQ
jgi:hypothetical protein